MMRPRLLTLSAALAAVLVAGCGSTKQPSGGAAAPNQTFTYDTYTQVMVGWDPSTSYSNEIIAMQNMYETLTRYDISSKTVKPLLAQSFSSSSGGKEWRFTLRKGVKFHTGRPVDAEAAKAAIERTMKLKQGAAYIWDSVKSIETPDASTLVFHLKYAAPLDLIASADYAAYIYDVKAAGSSDLTKWFEQGHDAGTGPYTVDSWHKGQEVELRLKRFGGYWGGWKGAHYQRVVYRVVPTATTAAQLLRAGQVSWVEQLTPELWQSFSGSSDVTTTKAPSFQNLFAMLNTKSGPLADLRVRQALSYATDYDGIVAALHGAAVKSSGVVPPGLWGHFDDLPSYTYDQAKAKSLLAKAGYGPGKKAMKLTLTYTQGDSAEQTVSTLLKSTFAQLNVQLDVQALQWPTQWGKAKSDNTAQRQDILLFYWWPDYADPYSWFINLFHSEDTPYFNLAYYSNAKVDAMMTQAEQLAASDRQRSIDLYRTIQEQLLADAPAIFVYNQVYERAMLSSVGGFKENAAYPNVVFAYDLEPK
jgi:peptide/nickel transport system substrate-binding protein